MNTASTCSPLHEINAAIELHNPFSQPPFVNANNIWGKGFPDVETLNAHASDAVFQALEDIRAGKYSTASILITAQDGTGKTHIISRIRHRLQIQGGALFVFVNKFNDLNQVKQGFQQSLADSLSNIGSQGVKQWQELATAMANDVFGMSHPGRDPIAPKDLVKKFESSSATQNAKWINQLTTKFCKNKSVQDPDIVRAIFWTLSEDEALYASNWLAGKELAQFKANDLRLPNQKQSFDAVLQILSLISDYNELVVCFDELDVLEFNDAGLHKSQVVANLVKELFENLKRGVILSVMMPGIWQEKVLKEMPRGVSSKMTTFCDPLDLKYLDADSTVELVGFFLKEFYDARELVPPHSVYPFDEGSLRAIGREKPTVREVLKWCRENCKPLGSPGGDAPDGKPPLEQDPVEFAFNTELSSDIQGYMDDNYLIADALLFAIKDLIGLEIEGVAIREVTTGVDKKGYKDPYLNFKILGKDENGSVSIGVAVLQYDGGRSLGAGFKRLLDEENRFGLTRGCLVRSHNKPLNAYFQKTYLTPLVEAGGEFVDLKQEDIKPLIAMHSVYKKRKSDYGVSEQQILEFIKYKGKKYHLGEHNALVREILSDPSYTVPGDLQDEPEVFEKDWRVDSSKNEDSVEASELEELMVHA